MPGKIHSVKKVLFHESDTKAFEAIHDALVLAGSQGLADYLRVFMEDVKDSPEIQEESLRAENREKRVASLVTK